MSYRDTIKTMPSLSLIALGEALHGDCLCWRCSKPQPFYASPCEHCAAINPNFDLDGALAQQNYSAANSTAVKE